MDSSSKFSVDDLFKIIMINRNKGVRVNIELRDENNDKISIRQTVEQLTEWILDQVRSEEDNRCHQQILPLMSQSTVSGLSKLLGPEAAAIMMANDVNRFSFIYIMTIGFYLVKWIQKNKIQIHTYEEPISKEEIEQCDRVSKASDVSVSALTSGIDPKTVLDKMVELGKLQQSDLERIGYGDKQDKKKTDPDTN